MPKSFNEWKKREPRSFADWKTEQQSRGGNAGYSRQVVKAGQQDSAVDQYVAQMNANAQRATDAYEKSRDEMNRSWWDVLGNAVQSGWNAVNGIQPSPEQGIKSAEAGQRLSAAVQSKDERGKLFRDMETAKSAAKDAQDYRQYVTGVQKYGSSEALFQSYADRIKEIEDEYRNTPDMWREARKHVKELEQERDSLKDYEDSLKKGQANATLLDAWSKGHGGTYESYRLAQQNYNELDRRVTQLQNELMVSGGAAEVDYSGYVVDDLSAATFEAAKAAPKADAGKVQAQLEAAIREREQAKLILQYAQAHQADELNKAPDFELKAASGEEKFKAFKQEQAPLRESWETNAGYATDEMSAAAIGDYVPYDPRLYSDYREPDERWTEDEKKRFYYLFDDEKTRQQAYDYAIGIDQKYNRSDAEARDWSTREFATRNFGTGAMASALSVPANLVGGGVDYMRMALENSARGGVYETQYDGWSRWADTTRGAIAEKLNESGTISKDVPVLGGKGLGDLYQLMMSMADSSVAVMAGGGAANAVFFGSAAASTTRDALERGISGNRAVALGFAAGAAEVAGETLSVEHLLKQGDIADYLRHGLLREMAKQGGVEASEEVLTSILNMIADAVINGDQAELQQKVYVNVANGMAYDEAVRQASKEWLEDLGTDALGGFLSGGLMSGGRLALQSGAAAVTKYTGDAKGDLELARLTTEGSRSRSLADQYQQRLDKKGSITNLQAARLQAQTSADISAADRPALLRAAEARLRDQSTSKLTSGEYKRMAQDVVDGVLDGKDGKFATALEQNVYEEMRMQIAGETVRTGNWLDDAGLKLTEARNAATKRMKMVETKDGEKAEVKSATMKDGELQLTIEQDGETKPVDLKDLKLDQYQMRALKTLTDTLGDDAAAAYNLMSGTGLQYGRASSIASYATAFGIIRDTFGRSADTEKAEAAALASSLRKGLTDEQVRYAVAIGQKRAKENGTIITREKSVWGTGKVTMDGGTLNDGTVLQGVKNKAQVLRSRQYAAVKAVAKALGIDVVLFESRADKDGNLSGAQGAYQDGVIYLDWNAGMNNIKATSERMLLRTMSHELTHFLQQNASEDYEKLKNYVTSYLAEKMGENYRKLVMEKMANQPGLSYDGAIDEVVADSCETMLRDSQYVQEMVRKDRSFGQKIWDWIKSFFRKIEASDTGAKYMQATIDELRDIWDSAMQNAVESRTDVETSTAEMKAEVLQSNTEALTEIDPTEEAATATMPDGQQYSIRSMKHDIAEGKMFEDLARYTDMSREETQELRKNLERLTDIIALNRDILDLNESFGKDNRPFKPYKPNSDPLYTLSLDFSTLCRKRLMTQYVIERLQTELTDSQTGKRGRPLTAEEQLAVRDLMKEYAQQEKALKVACAMCYVEAARLKAPGQIQRFMRDPTEPMRRYFALKNKDFNASVREAQADFKEQHGYARDAKKADMKPADRNALNKLSDRLRSEYRFTAEEQAELDLAKTLPNETYLTAANLARLAEEHPVIYDAYTATIRSATRSKSLEADIPYYYGDSSRVVSDDFIAAVNRENGMRFSSWSDFQIQHMLDMMTAVIELSTRHCAMHGYTKFLEQVRIFGKTGMMFNMSGVANGTGLKADGSLDFSPTESVLVFGQDGEYDAIQAREDFPETAGLQCIGISTEHIQALLDSDIIDYIIPYHTSGLNATLRRMAQISNWKDFTAFQNAKQDPSIRFDPSIHDRETWHKEPVFSEFFNAAKQESNGYRAGEKGIVTMRRAADLYKQMCRERGMMPKFSWGNSKVDADFSNDPNYWKLLIDRKMINQKTGALIEQKPVRPDFDFKLIEQMVQEAVDAYDPTLQDRALNYVREHLDELPQRIADLKKAGAVKKATSKTNKAAKTLQAGPVAAVSEGNTAPQLSVRKAAPVQPSDGSWQRGHSEEWFRQNGFPIYSDVPEAQREANEDAESKAQEERDKRDGGHGTQIEGTEDTYRKLFESIKKKFPDRWQNMRILDASSGLGYGTRAGREMGFKNITDIEPFWNRKKYDAGKGVGTQPDYEDYSYLQDLIDSGEVEPFDFIISNAVLNVVPQDTRDDLTVAMGQMLKPGGQMFVNVISKDYEGAVKSTPEVQTKTLKSGKVVNIGAVRTMEGDYSKGGNMNGRGHETFVWKSNSVQKVFSYPELAGYLRDALGPGYTFEKASLGMTGVMAKKSAEASQRMPQMSARKSWNSMTEAEQEQAVIENRAFNESQTRTGSPLVTLKGSDISRGGTLAGIRYPIGKVIGGRLYIHKSYADTIGDIDPKFRETLAKAEDVLQREYPGFQYNCINYHPASGEIQFQEAPDFDTAREPVVGMQINVQADGTVTEANRGKPFQQIWHHKWQWVGNDYTGFNVRESWEWSKEWLSTILGASKGGSMRAWNEQLAEYGLPEDGSKNAATTGGRVQMSVRSNAKTVDPSGITPVNEITDRSKYDYLVDSFRKDGYRGRPIVAVGDEGDAVALTGSHRLAAAKEADIDVPVVFIPYDSSNEYIMALVDAARDEDRTLAAREAYEAGAISKDVYDLIAREDELNSENYDVPYDQQARFSMRGGTKTDTQLLRDLYDRIEAKVEARAERNEAGLNKAYQRMLSDKQGVIYELQENQRKALEKFHELSERYYEKEREVNAALQELDRLVQHSGDRKAIQAQRAKVSAKEQQMAKALERLTQAKGGSEIQEILRQEREIQMQRTQDRIRDSIDRRDLRQRINKLWKDLNQKVTSPSEKKRIPVELMQQTLDVLEAINMDTSREGSKTGEKLRAKLDSLRARYEELKNDPDFRRAAVYDAQVAEYLTNMIAQVGDTPINKMSVAQMETVLETLKAMVHTASRALKLKLGEQELEAYEVSKAMTKETRSVEKPKTGFLSTWLNAQLSPERMFNRLGGYSKDSYWGKVYGMLNEGQLKQTRLQMEGSLIFEDLMEKENEKNFQKLLDPKNTVDIGLKDENGEPVLITHGMMISLYMHLQNDQNRDHVLYGGLTIPSLKDYYNGKKVKGEERAVRVGGVLQEIRDLNERIDNTDDMEELLDLQAKRDQIGADYYAELMTAIEAQLTDYDRQWIAASRELFDGFSKRELNKTTLDVYGIKRANVENYFPIWVDGDFLNTPFETVAKDLSLENAGFMKERINSKKPIRLGDISDVASSQIRKVAQYCGLMPAIRGFNKVWGKTEQDYRDSLQKAVHETFGQAGVKYVENLMADLNGARGGQDSALGEFLNRMRGHMAQASLTMSLRVAMGQTASYPTAAAVVGWGPLMKALAHGGRNNTIISRADQELIRKWSPLLYYRLKGYSTTELGDIAGMNDKFSRLWKKARWLTGWIQAMDGATVGRLWYAAEYYVQDHNKALVKGTDAYYEAVAKVFNDIVEKTQPDYTTMQRPDILRSPNALVKQLTMFLTQRLQNFNILYDAAATYSKYKADAKAGRNGVTTEDVRQAGIATRRAVISQVVAAATITGFKFLADALLHSMNNYRDDDDEELKAESISQEILDMFMDSLAGNVLGGGEIYDLIESKVFGKTYYGIEVGGLATVMDMVDAFSSTFDHVLKAAKDDEYKYGREQILKDVDKLARNISTVAGIPYANGKKIALGLYHHALDIRNGAFLSFEAGVERSNAQQASRLYRAYTNGDGAKVKQILEEVPEDKQKDVYSAVRKLIREQQKSGELNVYEAMRQMKNYGGSTDQIMAEYIKDLYEAGALPKADAEKYLQEYAGKTKEAATKTVTNVDGKQASGVNYNDIDDMFKLGTMNAEEARKALVGYGIAQDTANMKVEYWSYQQKNPGTAMTTEDRFETYWKKYRPVGMTPSMYDDFYVQWNAVQGTDKNHDGKADANSKKYERIAIIDSLPLSREQKDALFSMEWKTGLQDAPWNK